MADQSIPRRRVLLVGATGLVGRSVIARTADLPQLVLQGLARREMQFPEGARMELVLADTEDWGEVVSSIQPEAVICALGTTIRKAGSQEAFRKVDYDLVMQVARAAKEAGTRGFVHVSSVGAETGTKNFYLRTKGEVERDLKALHFKRLDVLRPGLLRGTREGDVRFLEGMGRLLAPVADLFLQGSWTKYRSIRASDLTTAALQCVWEKADGQFVHEHEGLQRLITKFEKAQAAAKENAQ
ncbi:NAD(P)H-binding protein [Aurantiacibacter sp. D1-12]|uniref:NAD(P)H-binding protein n=1 Tax=Aurantiacibacter sp. D1-12 TaxID=2993658 RepID=UPI00237CA1D9|nr:NAD(P)H-binding protein [Aurantiacibacter sp. D1-12]MDE1466330.1 NAD(P)H-binding protein [Aurantiacibacter sp. D1-12]